MYKRIRYISRYIKVFITRHRLSIFFSFLILVISIFLLPRLVSSFPRFRSNRHIAIIGRYTLSDLPLFIRSMLGIGLTVIGESGLPGPGIALSWENLDDGKTVIFHLNPKLKWQDDTIINSNDIQYIFKDAQIDHPDPSTIIFKLKDSYSPLTSLVSRPVFKRVSGYEKNKIIGTGSYTVKSFRENGVVLDTLVLAPVNSDNSMPLLNYHFFSSPQQARTAFKLGVVEEISDIYEIGDLISWPNTEIISVIHEDRYVAVFFNTDDPWLSGVSGKNLRLALAYATSKPTDNTRALSPIGRSSWAYNPDVKKYEYDLDRAIDLLDNVEQIPQKLTLRTLPAYIEIAENIKSDWEKLGLSIDIVSQPELPQDFQIALVAQAIPLDPDQYIYWHSTQETTNITQLKNPRIDKLLEDGRKIWEIDERKRIYADFQKYLVEEVPAIFLYYPTTYSVYRK